MLECPECGAALDYEEDELEEGDIITCPDCDIDLEVVSTDPIEFELAEGFDEDDEDFEEEDEDEDEDEDDLDGFSEEDDFSDNDDLSGLDED